MPTNADGFWPAFWLLKNRLGPDEIDISEWLGNGPTTDHMTYHSPTGGQTQGTFSADFSTSSHTFGCMWTPTSTTWYVDGTECFITSNNVSSLRAIQQPASLPSWVRGGGDQARFLKRQLSLPVSTISHAGCMATGVASALVGCGTPSRHATRCG
jgi:beta-glucanase (GH16 family)